MNIKTTESMTIECPHCRRALTGTARFGLDVICCEHCAKFLKIETFAKVQRVLTSPSVESYAVIIDTSERI